jgi:hypothetical protein
MIFRRELTGSLEEESNIKALIEQRYATVKRASPTPGRVPGLREAP